MIIDCISDLHGYYPKLEGGDLLIVAGDLTARDEPYEYNKFAQWIMDQQYRDKIVIGGNHDNFIQGMDPSEPICKHFTYLCDSGAELEYEEVSPREWGAQSGPLGNVPYIKKKLKIWGSPWTSRFEGINPHCCAFTGADDDEIAPHFKLIPSDVDILITHSPPFTIRDLTKRNEQVGSPSLMTEHIHRIRPKLWVFGHIHEGYGQEYYDWSGCKYVNASHVNERYQPVNKPIRIEL